jgi:integrase/recombinase XerD
VTAPAPLSPDFPALVRDFFCQRLLAQRNASPQTIAAYRDTFRLLLRFLQQEGHEDLAVLTLSDLDAPLVMAFLDHLERDRHNGIRTRNARLVALRSFFQYAAGRDPANLPTTQRVLAIPQKRCDTPLLGFLTREEIDAVLAALDLTTWSGQRDQALLATLYNTGARVSEAIGLRVVDLLGVGNREATLHLRGKGRKERLVPLWKSTARLLAAWVARNSLGPEAPLFPNRGGARMTRSGVAQRLRLAVDRATSTCPSLRRKRISPHAPTHDGHAPAPVRCQHHRDRAVARARGPNHDPSLRGGGHINEAPRTGDAHGAIAARAASPAQRGAARLPRGVVNMRSRRAPD